MGGLASALVLRSRGLEVTLLEQGAQFGGKCNRISWDGFHFDTGPSLLTMPFVLESLFQEAGTSLEAELNLDRLDPACRYFFPDGTQFQAPGRAEDWDAAIAEAFPGNLAGWQRFRQRNQRLWEVSFPVFLNAPLDGKTPFRVPYGKALRALPDLFPRSMNRVLYSDFEDPRLRMLLQRYATYNGSDPARAPATFNVIQHAEMLFGSWHIRGGMYALVEALVRVARKLGVELLTGKLVDRLRFEAGGGRVTGLDCADGSRIETERVIINADAVSSLAGPLFREHPRSSRWQRRFQSGETSVSGFVLLLAVDRPVEGLDCHNIFFPRDYRQEFDQIFDQPAPLSDPTLYLHRPSQVDPSLAPPGGESWFVLVNAPPLDRFSDWEDSYAEFVLQKLEQRLQEAGILFSREWVSWQRHHSPQHFKSEYSAWQGSLYGLSSNTLKQAFLRVPNAGPIPGVAFCGGSAHPGGGIPLVLQSGRFAAEHLVGKEG